MSELNYKVNEKEPESSFEAMPAGEYLAIIEDSDYAENKKGTGMGLKLTYQIIDGPMKGRKIFETLNLENTSKQAEEISRKALNSIGMACGLMDIKDSVQLHNIPLKIDVTVKESEDYGKQNRIRKHIAVSKNVQKDAKPPVENQEESPAKKGKVKPWER